MSLNLCKDTQEKCIFFRVEILKRCDSYMRVLLYTIKRSLAKLNIKGRNCAAMDQLTLAMFSYTSSPGCIGKEVTPYIGL